MEFPLLVLQLLLLLPYCKGGIQVGHKLAVKQPPWISQNNTFAFGFRASDGSGALFTLAIWYQSTGTVIWEASQTVPGTDRFVGKMKVTVGSHGELVLKETGLVLTDVNSTVVWSSELPGCQNCSAATASLEETGNFVVLNSTSDRIWQSFDSPTDTLVPEQELRGQTALVAGNYMVSMSKQGIGVYFQDYLNKPFWSMINTQLNTSDRSMTAIPKLTFDRDGRLAFYDGNGSSWYRFKFDNAQRYPIDFGDTNVFRRLTLEKNGTLRSYSRGGEDKSWRIVWQSNLLECEVFGTCGAFGMCGYHPRKSCSCPAGFHAIDPEDESAGCTYNFPLNVSCSSSNTSMAPTASKMVEVARAMYVGNVLQTLPDDFISLEQCKNYCLQDCRCLGATYGISGTKRCTLLSASNGKLFNGVQSMERAAIALLKVSVLDPVVSPPEDQLFKDVFVTVLDAYTPPFVNPWEHWRYLSKSEHILVFAIAIAELVIFSLIAISTGFCWRRSVRNMWKKAAKDHRGPTRFSYEQLEVATGNFSHKLGSGGFGTVYKGVLPDMTLVAVKNLEAAAIHGEKQFKAEVTTLGRIHHINLVKLLGYCAEGNHRLLVYEFLSNGSLEQEFIELWETRYSIAIGLARGISYLHEECYECILHCDIKPQNILLDDKFCPKVADFGLAKFTDKELALNVTTIRGTRGYMAPEWISDRPITAKVDVYSYGMVLLELLSGHDKSRISDNRYFPVWAFQKYVAGELESIVDPALVEGGLVNWSEFERALKIAFWCIQLEASSRPSMSQVMQMLEDRDLEVAVPPFPTPLSETGGGSSPSYLPPEAKSIMDPR